MKLNAKTKTTIKGIFVFLLLLGVIIVVKRWTNALCELPNQVNKIDQSLDKIKKDCIIQKPDSNYSKPKQDVFDYWIKMDSTRFKQ